MKRRAASFETGSVSTGGSPDCGFYVYCIMESAAIGGLPSRAPEGIRENALVEAVCSADLAAIVSRVPLSEFGQPIIETKLRDADWTAARVLGHERIVEYFGANAPLIPLRFGAIYLTRAGVRDMLERGREQFASVLARLRGNEEWGVWLHCDNPDLLERSVQGEPELARLVQEALNAPPGTSYLLSKRIEALKADAVRRAKTDGARRVLGELQEASVESLQLPLPAYRKTDHGELVAKFACLVAKDSYAVFRERVDVLADSLAPRGFHIELAGPLPAYSFVQKS